MNDLKKRAKQAFDTEFRDKLEKAVQKWIAGGGKIGIAGSINTINISCRCPEGCLFDLNQFPGPASMMDEFGFSYNQHADFQDAFDTGTDNKTPESALGLLYRRRFLEY